MVATGRVERGMIRFGDKVAVLGIGVTVGTVCAGVEMFKKPLDVGQAGENVGILLRGLRREDVGSGYVLAMPGTAMMWAEFTAEVYVLDMEEGGRAIPFPNHYRPQFYFRRMDVKGSISFPRGREMVTPGDNLSITVKLSFYAALVCAHASRSNHVLDLLFLKQWLNMYCRGLESMDEDSHSSRLPETYKSSKLYSTLAEPLKFVTNMLSEPLLNLTYPAFQDLQMGGKPIWETLKDDFPGALKSGRFL
ncbi:elongation factor Tu [Penicillium soppii]|uniref:elongation factor Tu n=1 Tax=Penicillium soppii TaxID=69789 RepID=UPI0025494167|nr:elongation factor Tu [Penicillium soppii]KAJ5871812.1 elongation factor Tu [Penicillium soppii]